MTLAHQDVQQLKTFTTSIVFCACCGQLFCQLNASHIPIIARNGFSHIFNNSRRFGYRSVSNYFFCFLFYLSIASAINPRAFPISNILMLVKRFYGAQEALDQIWHGHNVFRPRAWESLIYMQRTIKLVSPAWGKRFWSVVFMTKYKKDNFLFERFVENLPVENAYYPFNLLIDFINTLEIQRVKKNDYCFMIIRRQN